MLGGGTSLDVDTEACSGAHVGSTESRLPVRPETQEALPRGSAP